MTPTEILVRQYNQPPLAEILVRRFNADVGRAMQYMAEHDCEWEVALVRSCPKITPRDIAHQLLTPAAQAEFNRAQSAAQSEFVRAASAAWAEYDRAASAASAEYDRKCAEISVRLYHEQSTTS